MKINFATIEIDNVSLICLSRENILDILYRLDKDDTDNRRLITFLELLDQKLVEA